MNGRKIVWLWLVTGGRDWRGVADSFGQAQHDAETCIENGGKSAVVESAVWGFNGAAMQWEYTRTGRRCTARRVGGQIEWTDFGWSR
ncbi:MAG: hypothetical protein J2P28_26540 [Actinobacteria bacterium]|nr:hypothetical protein [Actinomycetota bacterium]